MDTDIYRYGADGCYACCSQAKRWKRQIERGRTTHTHMHVDVNMIIYINMAQMVARWAAARRRDERMGALGRYKFAKVRSILDLVHKMTMELDSWEIILKYWQRKSAPVQLSVSALSLLSFVRYVLQCGALCCSVLQCVIAVCCCSVLQYIADSSRSQYSWAWLHSILSHSPGMCCVLQYVAVCCNVLLQCVAVRLRF